MSPSVTDTLMPLNIGTFYILNSALVVVDLGDIRLDESGFGFRERIRDAPV